MCYNTCHESKNRKRRSGGILHFADVRADRIHRRHASLLRKGVATAERHAAWLAARLSDEDFHAISIIACLKKSCLPLAEIRRYMSLTTGDGTQGQLLKGDNMNRREFIKGAYAVAGAAVMPETGERKMKWLKSLGEIQ